MQSDKHEQKWQKDGMAQMTKSSTVPWMLQGLSPATEDSKKQNTHTHAKGK